MFYMRNKNTFNRIYIFNTSIITAHSYMKVDNSIHMELCVITMILHDWIITL